MSEYYTDIAHGAGDYELWCLINGDIKLKDRGREGAEHGHHPGMTRKAEVYGRVDHEQNIITTCGDEDDPEIKYAKRLFNIDLPGYRWVIFW